MSEQINAKKIIFTLDDQYVAFDIKGDNKLIWLEWDDLQGLLEQKTILAKIKAFKDRNMRVIDGLKSKLYREKLYPEPKHHKMKNKKSMAVKDNEDSDAGEGSIQH